MSATVYWEDVEPGRTTEFGAYRVNAEEIKAYARAFDPQPFHLDEAAGRDSPYGGLIASGWHTAAMMMRMICDHRIAGHATMGSAGFDDLTWRKPVRPGDVLRVRSTIQEKTASARRADRGRVRVRNEVLNQADEVVMALTALVLYRRRPVAAEAADR